MAKGILDWNGTGAARIQRVYDHNGTTATQLKKAYDWNGTAATPVYSAETVLFSGGSTADSGTWSSGGVGYTNAGSPVVTTYLGFGAGKCNSYFGALLWTGKRISMTQGQKLSFYMDSTAYSTYDTNLANGTQHLCRLEVVCGYNKPSIAGVIDVRAKVGENCCIITAVNGYQGYYGSAVSGSMKAGTYTVTIPVTGTYYLGFLWNGYDAIITRGPGINQVVLKDA